MSFSDPIPFDVAEFADNPEPRCPCLLLLDTSRSMAGRPIGELNAGLMALRDALGNDELASRRVELAIVSFGPARLVCGFHTADGFVPPTLLAANDTPLGEAVGMGIDLVARRKEEYKQAGIAYYRPWILLVSDGAPTDDWERAAQRVRAGEMDRAFSFFPVGVQGANFDTLQQLSSRRPLRLKDLRFADLFVWLSNSMRSVSRSSVGEAVPLENPASPEGWAFA
ncbi:MAG: vWA domain-containing protein [Candidatus Xenobia bacterium]